MLVNDLETTITQKGQVTIPAAIQRKLGLQPKARDRFEIDGDVVTLKPAGSRLLAGFGAVESGSRPEDWRCISEEFETGIAANALAEG
jgi:AbrB family looped-hinge helix DNA binding protein